MEINIRRLGFKTIVFLDSDLNIDQAELEKTRDAGVHVFLWAEKRTLEQAMFNDVSDAAVDELLDLAVELNSEEEVASSIAQMSEGNFTLESVRESFALSDVYATDIREILGDAAKLSSKAKKGKAARRGWFKSINRMEAAGDRIIGPRLRHANGDFRWTLEALFAKIHG